MRALLNLLLQRRTVLLFFPAFKAVAAVVNGLAANTAEAWGIGILAVLVYSAISWFAWRGRIISIWAITVLMLFEASGLLLGSLAAFGEAPVRAVIGVLLTLYLILGGLIVFSSRRNID